MSTVSPEMTTRLRCEWYARGYNDHRPLSGPVIPSYISPPAFADWYIAHCKDVSAPLVGIADAFTMFKAEVESALVSPGAGPRHRIR